MGTRLQAKLGQINDVFTVNIVKKEYFNLVGNYRSYLQGPLPVHAYDDPRLIKSGHPQFRT
jgi:hypothetical protein